MISEYRALELRRILKRYLAASDELGLVVKNRKGVEGVIAGLEIALGYYPGECSAEQWIADFGKFLDGLEKRIEDKRRDGFAA